LKETQAPDGYRTPNNYHYFVISDNSHSYTASGVPDFKSTDTFSEYKLAEGQMFGSFYYYCENTPNDNSDYVLPSTGGTGTLPYTAVGGTMMLTALAYSFIHRKRRREGRADD
jgi:LPXTG-motif cell wall-anchored protein